MHAVVSSLGEACPRILHLPGGGVAAVVMGGASVVVGGGSVVVGGGSVVVVMASVVVMGSVVVGGASVVVGGASVVVGRSSGQSVVGAAAKHLNSPVAFSHPQDTFPSGEHVMCTSSGNVNSEPFMAGQPSSISGGENG